MALLSQCQPHSHSCSLSHSWQRPALRHGRPAHELQKTKGRHGCGCRAGEDNEPPSSSRSTSLESTIRRKKEQVLSMLKDHSEEELMQRLESGLEQPARPEHRLASLIPEVKFKEGRPVLLLELSRASPAATSAEVAQLARSFEASGADALVVLTDAAETSTGLADLFSVCRAVRIPVVRRDWFLHPLQVLESKEAGAAGILGCICSVLGSKTALISSYAAALGLESPVEVVNVAEVESMEKLGVPMFGCNLGVGLSLALPGFRADIAKGILAKLPFGASSVVGAKSLEEAVKAKEAGADIIVVKKDWVAEALHDGGGRGDRAAQPSVPLSAEELETRRWDADEAPLSWQTEQSEKGLRNRRVLPDARIAAFISEIKYATSGDS